MDTTIRHITEGIITIKIVNAVHLVGIGIGIFAITTLKDLVLKMVLEAGIEADLSTVEKILAIRIVLAAIEIERAFPVLVLVLVDLINKVNNYFTNDRTPIYFISVAGSQILK